MYLGGEEGHHRMVPVAGRLEQSVGEWMGRLSRERNFGLMHATDRRCPEPWPGFFRKVRGGSHDV